MLSAYKFNYHHMPSEFKLDVGFDQERKVIFLKIMKILKESTLNSQENWVPLNYLIQHYGDAYTFQVGERQEIVQLLMDKIFVSKDIRSVVEYQSLFAIIVRFVDSKQKYFTDFKVDHIMLYQFMLRHFLTNDDKSIVSQTYVTSMFLQFCQFVKSLQYFFDTTAIKFAFQKFRENLGSRDKQLAWGFLTMFCPFRSDIPEHLYEGMLDYVVEAEAFDSGERENCRLRFILNYMRVYPLSPRSRDIVPHMFKIIHSLLRVDSNSEEKGENLVNILLPDEALGVESVYKLIPKLIVEMIGSSTREGYSDYMLQVQRLFQLFDSIMSVYNSQTWDDSLFKMLKLLVANFIYKYRRDQLISQITFVQKTYKYDEKVFQIFKYYSQIADELMEDLIREFESIDIQDFIESDRHYRELFCLNPDQGYQSYCQRYPDPTSKKQLKKHLKFHYTDITSSLLDQRAKDDFIDMVLGIMDKIVFMEDTGLSIAKTALVFEQIIIFQKYLCQFEPKTIDFFFKRMDIAFNNLQEVSTSTIKSILIFITNPIFQSKNDYQLKDLMKYMDYTYQLFSIRGVQENIDSLEFYDRVLLNCPVYTPEEFLMRFPEAESSEAYQACEFLSTFVLELFKLIIKNMHILKYKETDTSSVLHNLGNLFWPMICNCSDKMIESIVTDFLTHIENDLDSAQFFVLGDILDCLIFRSPERMLESIINLVSEKILRKRQKPLEPHYFNFLIENHAMKDAILEYEPAVTNKKSKKMWLTLLEKALSQSGKHIKRHEVKLLTIIMNYLREDEEELFEKTNDIIHTIIITVLIVRPKEFHSNKTFFRKDFNVKSQESIFKDFQVQWQVADESDWCFCERMLQTFLFGIKQNVEREYFIGNAYDSQMPQDFPKLADLMVFQTPPIDPKLKQKCYRLWFVMFASFSGVSFLVPLSPQDLDIDEKKNKHTIELQKEIQEKYFSKIIRPYFYTLRSEMVVFVKKAIVFSLETGIAHDHDQLDLLYYICSQTVGCSIIDTDLQMSREYLEGSRQLNLTTKNKIFYDTRMELISDIQQYIYTRHLFIMHLQGSPKYFTELYQYVMILVLSAPGDYVFPPFLLPYSSPTTKDLTIEIRAVFMDYICSVLDYTNSQSRLCQINNQSQHEKSKGYKQIQEILKAFYQSCDNISPNLGLDLQLHKKQHALINAIDHLDNKVCKQLLFDACIKSFTLTYDQNTFSMDDTSFNHIQQDQGKKIRLELLISSTKSINSNIFWKCKLIHTLIVLNNFNILLQCGSEENSIIHNEDLIQMIVEAFKMNCLSDHINLNSIGRVGLFYLMREAKRFIFKKSTRETSHLNQTNLETFLTWRFLPKEEVEIIRCSYAQLDTMNDLDPGLILQRAKNPDQFLLASGLISQTEVVSVPQNNKLVSVLRSTFSDHTFVAQFLERILVDKDVQPSHEFSTNDMASDNQEVHFMNSRGITKYIQILLSYIYIKDKKKQSPFSCTQSFFMADFYSRFFKKMFQVCGRAFFEASKQVIDQYAQEIDQKEKQRLVTYYVGGLSRSLLPVGNYAQDKLVQVLPHISQEIFTDNHVTLYYICKNQDWFWVERFMRPCLDCCKRFINDTGMRGFRYLHLLKIIIETQATRAYYLKQECFEHLELLFPNETRQVWLSSTHIDENVAFLSVFLLITLSYPIPTDIKHLIVGEKPLIEMTKNFVFFNDEHAQLFFTKMNDMLDHLEKKTNLTKNEEDNQKSQQELAIKLLEYIYIKRVNIASWTYIKQAISTSFDDNKLEVDTMEILRKQVVSDFTPEVEEKLMVIVRQKSNSDNWLIRKKANLFLRDWYFINLLCSSGSVKALPDLLLKFMDDKHPQIQLQALHSVSDYFRIFLPSELSATFQQLQNDDYGVVICMAMLLSRMDRTFEWSNEALNRVLKAYQRMPNRKKLIQEFVSDYWKTRQDNFQVFEHQISEENSMMLREIVNPYSYFA